MYACFHNTCIKISPRKKQYYILAVMLFSVKRPPKYGHHGIVVEVMYSLTLLVGGVTSTIYRQHPPCSVLNNTICSRTYISVYIILYMIIFFNVLLPYIIRFSILTMCILLWRRWELTKFMIWYI